MAGAKTDRAKLGIFSDSGKKSTRRQCFPRTNNSGLGVSAKAVATAFLSSTGHSSSARQTTTDCSEIYKV